MNLPPPAIGPYSQAIKAGGFVFVSGSIGIDPKTREFTSNDVQVQTEQALRNIQAILEEAGSSLNKVVKATVMMRDMGDYAKINEVYMTFFSEVKPARVAFAVVGLPKNALVEIDCIALA